MATKQRQTMNVDLTNPLAKTEPTLPQAQPETKPKTKSTGIALLPEEWARFEVIAAELGLNRHRLGQWVLRDFITRYERGEIETVVKKRLPGA